MLSLFSTRKIVLNILPELKHNEFIYKLVCKDARVPNCVVSQHKLATSPWLKNLQSRKLYVYKHFKGGNSDSEYIPCVRQQQEINLKPGHII